jgi:galactose mutarotase-like enzyme
MGNDVGRGRAVRVRLEAGGCAVEIAPAAGGRIAALEVHGWDLVRRDGWTDREWGSFVMAPWIGRLRDGRVRWRDRAWDMPLTEPPHALHGTVLDVPWDVIGATASSVRLTTGLGPDWPFEGRVARSLELRPDRLIDRLEVHATREPFPVILGWHPWFRRRAVRLADGAASGVVEVRIHGARRVDLDAGGLPTGRLAEPRPDPQDDVLLDVVEPPVVRWPGAVELALHAAAACAWIAYTAHPDGVCVEPLTGLPDGLNGGWLGDPPVVEPGRPLTAALEIRW